jgi:hypothetical protein
MPGLIDQRLTPAFTTLRTAKSTARAAQTQPSTPLREISRQRERAESIRDNTWNKKNPDRHTSTTVVNNQVGLIDLIDLLAIWQFKQVNLGRSCYLLQAKQVNLLPLELR